MTRNTPIQKLKNILLVLAGFLPVALTQAAEVQRPNIILFLVDDMGWTDCGAYGSQYYETPNVDWLAAGSMRFTQAYAHPLCSPSRASILTGQEETRHGIMSAHGHLEPEPWGPQVYQENPSPNQPFLLPKSRRYLDPEAVTLAEALQAAGYRTAHLGKWHLGLTEPHWPEAHGFETTFHCAPDPGPPGSTYFSPHGVHPDGHPSGKRRVGNITDGPEGEHIADRLAQEAIKFITAHKNEPFFLNLCEYPVHGPWEAKEEDIKYFKQKKDPTGRHTNPVMAAMLKSMDDSLGQVLKALDDLDIADDTIVVFFSDNGGNVKSWATAGEQDRYLRNPKHNLHHMVKAYREHAGLQPPTSNAPLRMGKSFLYEGGARVPLMVRWPDNIKAGETSEAIVNNIDLYPTLLELAGIPMPKGHVVDGLSFAPVLLKGEEFSRDTSFSWFPYHDAGISVRQGDWKLIRRFKENPDHYEGLVELYHLKEDLGETTNLAKKLPGKVAELGKLIDAHFASTGGLYPKPNPAHRKPAPKSATHGLVAKQCRINPIEGGIRVVPQGRQPFLGTAQVQFKGPVTLCLCARGAGGVGGEGRIQWRMQGQKEFPKSGQNIAFDLPAGTDWQDITVQAPVDGRSHLVRLHLPGAKTLEIQSIRWEAKGEKAVEWEFSNHEGKE